MAWSPCCRASVVWCPMMPKRNWDLMSLTVANGMATLGPLICRLPTASSTGLPTFIMPNWHDFMAKPITIAWTLSMKATMMMSWTMAKREAWCWRRWNVSTQKQHGLFKDGRKTHVRVWYKIWRMAICWYWICFPNAGLCSVFPLCGNERKDTSSTIGCFACLRTSGQMWGCMDVWTNWFTISIAPRSEVQIRNIWKVSALRWKVQRTIPWCLNSWASCHGDRKYSKRKIGSEVMWRQDTAGKMKPSSVHGSYLQKRFIIARPETISKVHMRVCFAADRDWITFRWRVGLRWETITTRKLPWKQPDSWQAFPVVTKATTTLNTT